MKYREWITRKYIDWRGDAIGNEGSIIKFGKTIGADKTSLSLWMSGKRKPGLLNIQRIALVYPDIYEVEDLPKFAASLDIPPDLPPRFRKLVLAATRELSDTLAARNIDPASPEAESLSDAIMEKYGFKRTSTENSGKSG